MSDRAIPESAESVSMNSTARGFDDDEQLAPGDDARIVFSHGASMFDARPKRITAADFPDFEKMIDGWRQPKKGLGYICSPFSDGHRCQVSAEPVRFLVVDLDRIEASILPDLRMWLANFAGCGWPTHSSTPEKPRERALLLFDRSASRNEVLRVGAAFTAAIKAHFSDAVEVDGSTFRIEQPCYLPPTKVTLQRYHGDPLWVDEWIARPDALAPVSSDQNATQRLDARARTDPVLQVLQDRGLLKGAHRTAGWFNVVCPCSEHHTSPSQDDSSVYMLPMYGGMKWGSFKCLHDHCSGRPQEQFLHALGLEVEAVRLAQGAPAESAVGRVDGDAATPGADDWHDAAVLASKMPAIDDVAFYGPLQGIVEAATAHSEATKIGVALSVIAQFSLLLRPFYAPLGDERPGLNVYLLQVGQSALARKGTSAALANEHIAPSLRERAAKFAEFMSHRKRKAQSSILAIARAQRRHQEALAAIESAKATTSETVTQLKADLSALQDLAAARKASLADAEAKREATFGTRGYSIRGKTIEEGHAELRELQCRIESLEAQYARARAALSNPEGEAAELKQHALNCLAELNSCTQISSAEPAEPDEWALALAALARKPVILTGVSSGEGVIHAIRDPQASNEEDDAEDPGVEEKRMLLELSEYGGMLSLMRRPGSTLSSVMRDAFDCRPLATNAKTVPVGCAAPYVSMSASITPAELRGLLFDANDAAAQADNGVGNRNLYAFVKRERIVSRPLPAEGVQAMVDVLWSNIVKVYRDLDATQAPRSVPFPFSEDGARAWDEIYVLITTSQPVSANAGRLYGRFEINCRKLACLLSAINGESQVSAAAVQAAYAWVKYCADTVDTVASTVEEKLERRVLETNAGKVMAALKRLGGRARSRDVMRQAKLQSKAMAEAVGFLANRSPAWIVVDSTAVTGGNGSKSSVAWLKLADQILS